MFSLEAVSYGGSSLPMAKKPQPKKLFEGEFVESMPIPNHTIPLIEDEDMKWPYLRIKYKDEEEARHVFFDPVHGEDPWQWEDRAPTWMDPGVFLEMCKNNSKVQAVLKECITKQSDAPAKKKLPAIFDEIMEEEYLVYMLEQFEDYAREHLIEWLARRAAYEHTDPNKKGNKPSRRGRKAQ